MVINLVRFDKSLIRVNFLPFSTKPHGHFSAIRMVPLYSFIFPFTLRLSDLSNQGFFRRTINERESQRYTCRNGGNCAVTGATRNNCKSCRYRRCLAVGMSKEGGFFSDMSVGHPFIRLSTSFYPVAGA